VGLITNNFKAPDGAAENQLAEVSVAPSGALFVLLWNPRLKPWATLDCRSAASNGFKNAFKKLCVLCVLCGYHFSVKPLTSYTGKLTDEQASALEAALSSRGFKFRAVPYARFAGEKDKINVVFYESGKLVVQGKGTQEFIEFVLEPEVLKQARLGYETLLNPDLLLPRIGVDESGKGDFFGPLCIAGVYINENVVKAWQDAGIRDSKNISSDKKIGELAEKIRKTPGCVVNTVTIGNEAYNRLYARMKSVNTILAWGHARVIENLMGLRHQMNPVPVKAISDQFASSKDVVAKALMSLGREIELVQRHKAEEDLAVAAASILARDGFVKGLVKLEKQFNVELPKGASTFVDEAAKKFVTEQGAENLSKIAKVHFRTAFRAQGLPEPPKKEWKKR
jgi:ribonuclease HIII